MILKTGRISSFPHDDGQQCYMGFLAPDPEDLLRMHYGQIDMQEFKSRYFKHLADSIAIYPTKWCELMERESITLLCDCGSMKTMAEQREADKLCHRFMLQEFIADLMKAMDKAVLVIKEVDEQWDPPLQIHHFLFGKSQQSKAPLSTPEGIIALRENTQSFEWP